MALLRFQRRLVNDAVWAFCWYCRHPERQYAYQWFFPSSKWEQHLASIEDSNYGRTVYSQYAPFCRYMQRHYHGPFTYSVSLLRSLELYTSNWRDEHFQYAHELLSKYYGVPCDGQL